MCYLLNEYENPYHMELFYLNIKVQGIKQRKFEKINLSERDRNKTT